MIIIYLDKILLPIKRIQSLPSPGLIVKNNNFKNIMNKFELKISKYSSDHKTIKKNSFKLFRKRFKNLHETILFLF